MAVIIVIVIVAVIVIAAAGGSKRPAPSEVTMRCPSCGDPVRVHGDSWECPWCGDCGRCTKKK